MVLALFVGLVAWTALALGWTQSAERTMTELARAVTYLGVFVLALAVQRGRRWRALLYGVTTGSRSSRVSLCSRACIRSGFLRTSSAGS